MSYKDIILKLLDDRKDWVKEYDLEKVNTNWGFLGTSGGRRARELAEVGMIERRISGKYAEFRAKVEEPTQTKLI